METALRVLETSELTGGTLQFTSTLLTPVFYLDCAGVDPDIVKVLLDLLPNLMVIVAGENSLLLLLHLNMTSSDDPPSIRSCVLVLL